MERFPDQTKDCAPLADHSAHVGQHPRFRPIPLQQRGRLHPPLDNSRWRDNEPDPTTLAQGLPDIRCLVPDLVAAFAGQAAREHGFAPQACTVIFLAHGSRRNSASREATEHMVREVEKLAAFQAVRIALLEERPFLDETAASVSGPAIVVGLFSGEGMHGARDAPKLIAELGREDIVFAGVIGGAPGIADLVARSVAEALLRDIWHRNLSADAEAGD